MNMQMEAWVAAASKYLHFSSVWKQKRHCVLPSYPLSLVLSPLHSCAATGYGGCHPYNIHTHTSRLRSCFATRAAATWLKATGHLPVHSLVSPMFAAPFSWCLLHPPSTNSSHTTPAPSFPVSQGTRGTELLQLVPDCWAATAFSERGGTACREWGKGACEDRKCESLKKWQRVEEGRWGERLQVGDGNRINQRYRQRSRERWVSEMTRREGTRAIFGIWEEHRRHHFSVSQVF